MKTNVYDCKTFEPGQKLLATIKAVHKEGVLVEMPQGRGSGVISPRCWGDGEARLEALAQIRPGDEVEVYVRSYDAQSSSLSLALAGCDLSVAQSTAPAKAVAGGTVFLWDVANLFGIIGPAHAAHVLEGIAKASKELGYQSVFFMEHRAFLWACFNQESEAEKDALWDFSRRDDFLKIADRYRDTGRTEADAIILQTAEAIPDSLCISCDHFRKYAALHPTLVGTSRVRPFAALRFGGKLILTIDGLARAITVEAVPGLAVSSPVAQKAVRGCAVRNPDAPCGEPAAPTDLVALADACRRRGKTANAERLYAKAAKRDPRAYEALAEMAYEAADRKKADLYDSLACRCRKMQSWRSQRHRRRAS